MTWEDRLRDARYTAPSGTVLTFDYEATTEEFEQKGGAFEFADADGTYVQSMGVTGRRYPLRIILWGADCDIEAAAWMDALAERGAGVLEHPAYGRLDVVPSGRVRRRDDFVREANQAVIEVEFLSTIGVVYPSSSSQDIDADDADNAQAALLETFGTDVTEDASFLAQYNTALDAVSAALSSVTPDTNAFDTIEQSIDRGISVLVSDPLTLALQTQRLIQQPSNIISSSAARLEAYGGLFDKIVGKSDTVTSPVAATSLVALAAGDTFASGVAVGYALAAVNTEYANRPQAVEVAEALITLSAELAEYRDDSFVSVGEVDTGASWQATQQLIAEAAGVLIETSFDLAQERTLVLSSPRSIIDLSYELYGGVDSYLDTLINDNDLSGDEIIELPRGREVVYYA